MKNYNQKQYKTFNFFLGDLTEEAKTRFIGFLGGDEHNHSFVPFCTYETECDESEYLPGGESKQVIWKKYLRYLHDWAKNHNKPRFFAMTPACFEEWLDNEYQDDDEDQEDVA